MRLKDTLFWDSLYTLVFFIWNFKNFWKKWTHNGARIEALMSSENGNVKPKKTLVVNIPVYLYSHSLQCVLMVATESCIVNAVGCYFQFNIIKSLIVCYLT